MFQQCPSCDEQADRASNLTPMPDEEAEQLLHEALERRRQELTQRKRYESFETYYAEHCDRLGIPHDGPLTVDQVAMMSTRS